MLVGWILDIEFLKTVAPGLPKMVANTALAFVLAGASLWLLREEGANRRARGVGRACAVAVAVIGVLTLGEYLPGRDLAIEPLLFGAPTDALETSIPGRPSLPTALNFVLVGLALLLLDVKIRRDHWPAQLLALTAALVALRSLAGYTYGVRSFNAISAYTGMEVHATLTFSVLSAGLLCARPGRGVMASVTAESAGGVLIRRLLPAVIAMPLGLGLVVLAGQRVWGGDAAFGVSVLVVTCIGIFTRLIWSSGAALDRMDAARRQAGEQFRTAAEAANDAIVSADRGGKIVYFNPAAERIFGYAARQVMGRPLTILMPERFHEAHRGGFERFRSTGEARVIGKTVELVGRRSNGSEFPVELSLSSWKVGADTHFTGILRDITDRKRAEGEIAKMNARLAAANQELEAFTYTVSHDLKAPLRGMEGFARALGEDYGDRLDEEGRRYLGMIQASARRMGELIEDLLRYSRLERREMKRERVPLRPLLERVCEEVEQEIRERGLVLRMELTEEAVEAEREGLREALANLVGNAVKFSKKGGGTITIRTWREGNSAVLSVADTGIGFDMKYHDRIFRIFERLHRQEECPGTGVGLAIVSKVAERHGGRAWGESEPGKGSTFHLALPVSSGGQA